MSYLRGGEILGLKCDKDYGLLSVTLGISIFQNNISETTWVL